MPTLIALDTNVLLAASNRTHPNWAAGGRFLEHLGRNGIIGCFTAQTIREFWNVCTKPVGNNGFNLTTDAVTTLVSEIERTLTLLADDRHSYELWVRLVSQHRVRGSQVHDTYLAATIAVHNVKILATWNPKDFKRFDFIQALTPEEILTGI